MRIGFLLSVLLFAGQPAMAQSGFNGENMLLPIPEGFVEAFQGTEGGYTISEYVPAGQTVENWTQMLTIQLFRDADGADPMAFLGRLNASLITACPGSESRLLGQGETAGLPNAQALFICPAVNGGASQEVFVAHAIGGRDSLYVNQFAWRYSPSQLELQHWSSVLQSTEICDTRRADMPCPQ